LIKELLVKGNQVNDTVFSRSSDEVWELRLPQSKGTINIEGITYGWQHENKPLPVWTSSRRAYFDVADYHWLLSPRRFARNLKQGDEGEVEFSLYNNSDSNVMLLEINLEDTLDIGSFKVSPKEISLPAKSSTKLTVNYDINKTAPKGSYQLKLIAKDKDSKKQAFSLIEFRVDSQKKVDLPIQLKLFEHDQFQFAYEPNYPRDNQFYFDSENRPWLVSSEGLKVKTKEQWRTVSLDVNDKDIHYPSSTIGTDPYGNVYTIVNINNRPHLLRVNGRSLKIELTELPVGGTYKMETFMGGKTSDYPPAILRFVRNANQKRVSRWARKHRLELLLIAPTPGKLYVEEPILLSDNFVGTSDHSGISNSIAS